MKKKYSSISILIMLFYAFNTYATDYYINPEGGNDQNNGLSSSNAFRSLSRVDNLSLQPGDTVFFMGGTYQRPGQTLLTINESGTEDEYITFTNFENETPILEFDSWTGIDIIGGSSYIKIDGLHVKGARTKINLEDATNQGGSCARGQSGSAEGFYNGTGILAVGPNLRWSDSRTNSVPHHIEVTNCNVYDCSSSGMAFQQADYVTITNNEVYNNCWYTIYGTSGINLYQFVNTDGTTGFHNKISNNLMYGNQLLVPQVPSCEFLDGNGLIIDDFYHSQTGNYRDPQNGFSRYLARTLVSNNIAVQNGGSGLHFFLSTRCYIYNNTVADNAFQNDGDNGNGDLRMGIVDNFVVKNNIFKGDYNVHDIEVFETIDYTNNYQYGPGIYEKLIDCEGCISENEITFLNTDVTSETPYITNFSDVYTDAGIILPEVTDDYLGNPRPFGESYDIGAYELSNCSFETWYADADNDGFGSDVDSISDCVQPEGYVANSDDLCPNDPNKIAPGECGCGEEEGTCEEECEPTNWYADIDGDGFGDLNDIINDCEQPEGYVANSDDSCPNDSQKTEPSNWYADFDADGFGDSNDIIIACEQPEGYVANNNDSCANDNLKNEPGECGCGITEGTCAPEENSGELCSANEYDNNTIYSQSGTIVIFNGVAFENQWYTQGQLPTSGGPWVMIGFCESAAASDCSSIPLWSSDIVYSQGGTQVVFNQNIYENQWYTRGATPTDNNVWQLVGLCETTLSADINFSETNSNEDLVQIYSLAGELMMEYTTENTPDVLNLDSDIYIVKTTNSNGEESMSKISL